MDEVFRQLHARLMVCISQMDPSEEQLQQLKEGFTQHVEFLHPRYAIELWRANNRWADQEGLNDAQQARLRNSAAAYPFLTRAEERGHAGFDGNSSPHRAFALLRLGVRNGSPPYRDYKEGKGLEHLIDYGDGVEAVGASFNCPLSISLLPEDLRTYSDNSPIARFLLRARAVHLLHHCWAELAEDAEDVGPAALFTAWGGYFVNDFGAWQALVQDDACWTATQPYDHNRLQDLLNDRSNWAAYTRFREAAGIPAPPI